MGAWGSTRQTHHDHELINGAGVVFELPLTQVEPSEPTVPITDDPWATAVGVRNAVNNNPMPLPPSSNPLLALLAGGIGSLSAAGVIISNISFDTHGTYINTKFTHMQDSAHFIYKNHSKTFVSQLFTTAQISSSSTLVAAGGTGLVVAAAVYFIPWRKLARYMTNCWNHFLSLLASLWEFFRERWAMFLEFIGYILANAESWLGHIGSAAAICFPRPVGVR